MPGASHAAPKKVVVIKLGKLDEAHDRDTTEPQVRGRVKKRGKGAQKGVLS